MESAARRAPSALPKTASVIAEALPPGSVTQARSRPRRVDDVGHQHGQHRSGVRRRQREIGRVAGHVDEHEALVTDDPGVVTRRHVDHVARTALQLLPRVHADAKATGEHELKMVDMTRGRPHERLHISRPAPPRLEHRAPDGDSPYVDEGAGPASELTNLVGLVEALARDSRSLVRAHRSAGSGRGAGSQPSRKVARPEAR
jgi:hypothetical protein